MNHYRYADLTVGQSEQFEVKITEEMVDTFRGISGDVNPLHNDERFAKAHHFPARVVYGMLTASFLSTLAGVYLPGERCLIQSVETKFLRPVFIGDELTVRGTVAELNDSVRQVVLKVAMTSGGGRVLKGMMKLGVLEDEG